MNLSILKPVCWWLRKKPSDDSRKTEVIDQAIDELRSLNQKSAEVLNRVKQPDILRSLVISINSGRNQ